MSDMRYWGMSPNKARRAETNDLRAEVIEYETRITALEVERDHYRVGYTTARDNLKVAQFEVTKLSARVEELETFRTDTHMN